MIATREPGQGSVRRRSITSVNSIDLRLATVATAADAGVSGGNGDAVRADAGCQITDTRIGQRGRRSQLSFRNDAYVDDAPLAADVTIDPVAVASASSGEIATVFRSKTDSMPPQPAPRWRSNDIEELPAPSSSGDSSTKFAAADGTTKRQIFARCRDSMSTTGSSGSHHDLPGGGRSNIDNDDGEGGGPMTTKELIFTLCRNDISSGNAASSSGGGLPTSEGQGLGHPSSSSSVYDSFVDVDNTYEDRHDVEAPLVDEDFTDRCLSVINSASASPPTKKQHKLPIAVDRAATSSKTPEADPFGRRPFSSSSGDGRTPDGFKMATIPPGRASTATVAASGPGQHDPADERSTPHHESAGGRRFPASGRSSRLSTATTIGSATDLDSVSVAGSSQSKGSRAAKKTKHRRSGGERISRNIDFDEDKTSLV